MIAYVSDVAANAGHGRRLRRAAALAASLALVAVWAVPSASGSQSDYRHAYNLGLRAYKYGLPLLSTQQTYRTQTSVEEPTHRGYAPVNRFSQAHRLASVNAKTVVAPNHDTLYSIGWLNLKRQPVVIHVPRVRDRYYVFELLDPYTTNFRNLGSVDHTKPGDYAVVPRGEHVHLPAGVHRVNSPYDRVWVIARALVRGKDDIPSVVKLMKRFTLTPLARYGTGWRQRYAKHPDRQHPTHYSLPTGLRYLDRLGTLLERFPPPERDNPILSKLATVGVGPGMRPSRDPKLTADERRGLRNAVADGPDAVRADIRQAYIEGFAAHNGWLVSKTGRYGSNYRLRASVAQIGLGALVPSESIYPLAQVDHTGQDLTGAKRYVMHFDPGRLPPVRGFWSVSLYDLDGFFVPNPIDRYLINDRADLHLNRDGSLDVYIQHDEPTNPVERQNWLPAPAGGFRLLMRIYAPKPSAIPGILDGSGWDPPTITPR
jgi:hypothetical protein